MVKNPAEYVIQIFGGVRATARALGVLPGSVGYWKRSSKERGGGGHIPRRIQIRILKIARLKKLDITESDLIWGRRIIKEPSPR